MKENQKSWFRRHWILSIFLGLIVLGIIGSLFGGDSDSDLTGESIKEPSNEEVTTSNQDLGQETNKKAQENIDSSDNWIDDLEEAMDELEETTNIYKKIDECTELCAGEDIEIPYIKNICHSDCYQIYYYAGEEALDDYIEELRNE